MLSGTGAWSWSSASAINGDLLREANAFCLAQGRRMMPLQMGGVDAGFSNFAQGSLQFRCLMEGDPELRRPNLQPVPSVRIENVTR